MNSTLKIEKLICRDFQTDELPAEVMYSNQIKALKVYLLENEI